MNIQCLEKNQCCGCSSCYNACPVSAISMIEDELEGVLYPVIDDKKCIDCGVCVNKCPALHSRNPVENVEERMPDCFAAIANDEEIRKQSSSGGIFSLLALNILSDGGVVYGAAFDENYEVTHVKVDNEADLSKLRGSKYVQSKIAFTYKDVKADLEIGKKVLFSGTPCQCEGLAAFLGKDCENLFLVDLICHGAPSPKVWRKYVELRSQGKQITSISFRNKNISWEMFLLEFVFTNSSKYMQDLHHDTYMRGFLKDLYLRSSCYHCNYRKQRRISDITLADFWGVKNIVPEMYDNKGTSLVVVQSERGLKTLYNLDCRLVKCDAEKVIKNNSSYLKSSSEHPKRWNFYKDIQAGKNLELLIKKYTKDSIFKVIKINLRIHLAKIKILKNIYHKVKNI